MLQRIQTVYLLLSLTCVTIITFGKSIFQFNVADEYYLLNVFGIQKFNAQDELILLDPKPYYFVSLLFILLLLLTIFSFKNLKRQLMLGRTSLFLYFCAIVFLFFVSFLGADLTDNQDVKQQYNFGFYLLIVALPFLILANNSIKKDIQLLDSVNRLR